MPLENITLPEGSGIPSVGSILGLFNGASPGVYNPVGNFAAGTMDMKTVTADTTNMGTFWKQHIVALLDAGTFDGTIYFVPDSEGQANTVGIVGHSFTSPGALGYIYANGLVWPYSLTFPDGSHILFSATIDSFPIDMNVEKPLMVKIKFGITGAPQFFGF
jgi:hypothetical protein